MSSADAIKSLGPYSPSEYSEYDETEFYLKPVIVETETAKQEREQKEDKVEQEELDAASRAQAVHAALNSDPSTWRTNGKTAAFLISAQFISGAYFCRGCMNAITTKKKRYLYWRKCATCEHEYCSESCKNLAERYHRCEAKPRAPPCVVLGNDSKDMPPLDNVSAFVPMQLEAKESSVSTIIPSSISTLTTGTSSASASSASSATTDETKERPADKMDQG